MPITGNQGTVTFEDSGLVLAWTRISEYQQTREKLATGELDYEGFIELVATSAPSTGFCNTMGTATTMNSLAEALGIAVDTGVLAHDVLNGFDD